eukprot:1459585-Alexandrium_andersonii.AAC.1
MHSRSTPSSTWCEDPSLDVLSWLELGCGVILWICGICGMAGKCSDGLEGENKTMVANEAAHC